MEPAFFVRCSRSALFDYRGKYLMCEQTVIDSLENLKSIHRQRQGLLNKIKNVEEKLEKLKEESEYSRPRGLDGTPPEYEEGFESDEEPFLTEYDAENGPKARSLSKPGKNGSEDGSKDKSSKITTILPYVITILGGLGYFVYLVKTTSINYAVIEAVGYLLISPLCLIAAFIIEIPFVFIGSLIKKIRIRKIRKFNERAPKEYYDAHYTQRLAAHRQDIEKYQREEKERQKKISALENELELLGVRQVTIDAVIDADPCLPSRYKEYPTVTKLLDYLKNMRADSIKEAINLYESEEMQKDHTRRVMRAEAERNAYIKAAAEAQQQAAYEAELQRIAAQSMADNVAKQRRAAEDALDEIRDMRKQMDD